MKKTSIILTAFAALSLLFVSWTTIKTSEAALHLDDLGCAIMDGDGNIAFIEGQGVVTNSGNGNFTCKGEVPNSSGQIKYSDESQGFQYITPIGMSTSWSVTISSSGQATLQVKVQP
jgi:hypothetical protein